MSWFWILIIIGFVIWILPRFVSIPHDVTQAIMYLVCGVGMAFLASSMADYMFGPRLGVVAYDADGAPWTLVIDQGMVPSSEPWLVVKENCDKFTFWEGVDPSDGDEKTVMLDKPTGDMMVCERAPYGSTWITEREKGTYKGLMIIGSIVLVTIMFAGAPKWGPSLW